MNCEFCGKPILEGSFTHLWFNCAYCGGQFHYHFGCGPPGDVRQKRCRAHLHSGAASAPPPPPQMTTTQAPAKSTRKSPRLVGVTFSSASRVQTVSAPLLRASIGFEWQTSLKLRYERNAVPSKVTVLSGKSVFCESDSGELELVTDPILYTGLLLGPQSRMFPSWLEALHHQMAAVNDMFHTIQQLLRERSRSSKTPDAQRVTAFTQGNNDFRGQVWTFGTGALDNGRVQATIGVPLARLLELSDRTRTLEGLAEPMATVAEIRQKIIDDGGSATIQGFVLLIEMYLIWLPSRDATSEEGPKAALLLMCRCNFHAVFTNCLSSSEQMRFRAYARTHPRRREAVCELGYRVPGFHSNRLLPADWTPQVGEWLDSIIDPATAWDGYYTRVSGLRSLTEHYNPTDGGLYLSRRTAYDLLSPPPFYPPHDADELFTYAMGRDAVASGLVLFELRGLGSVRSFDLPGFMEGFAQFAFLGVINGKACGTSSGCLGSYQAPMPSLDDVHQFLIQCESADGHGGTYQSSYSVGGGDCFYDSFRQLRLDLGEGIQQLRARTVAWLGGSISANEGLAINGHADATNREMNALGQSTNTLIVLHSFTYGRWNREWQHTHCGVINGSHAHEIHIVHLMGGEGGHYQPLQRLS